MLRLERVGLGCCVYFIYGILTVYLYASGQLAVPLSLLVAILIAVVAINCLFFWVIATNRNLRFRDPALTNVQILLATVLELVMFAYSVTIFAQNLILFSFLMTVLFGAFRFNTKRIILYALPGFIGFALIMLVPGGFLVRPLPFTVPRLLVYTSLLAWFIIFSSYISRLRSHLSQSRKEIKAAMARIEELSIRDELTGAYNRRFIYERLSEEINRSLRSGQAFALCFLDVDHFKRINDTHGHLVGDKVLCELVRRLEGGIRTEDRLGEYGDDNLLCRFGGEEFLLVLPMTDLAGARACAERVCQAVRQEAFETRAGRVRVTVSGGVACYRHQDTLPAMLGRVDEALYRAKENGRDCVELEHQPRVDISPKVKIPPSSG